MNIKSNTENNIIYFTKFFWYNRKPNGCTIERSDFSETGNISFDGQETASGKISISEISEIVVSAGRGLKGPKIGEW